MAKFMSWDAKHFTKKQKDWCNNYQKETTFEPLMCDFVAGNKTFQQAARSSVQWFEDWSSDAFLKCDLDGMSSEWSDHD